MIKAVVALVVAALALGLLISGCPDPEASYKSNQDAENASTQPGGEDTSGDTSDQGTGDQNTSDGSSDGTSDDTGTGDDAGGGTDIELWYLAGTWTGKVQCTMENTASTDLADTTTTSEGEYTITFAEDGRPVDVAITAALGGVGENIAVTTVGETTSVTMNMPSLGPSAVMSQTITVRESSIWEGGAHLKYEYWFEVTGVDNLIEWGTGWQTFDWVWDPVNNTLAYTTTAQYDTTVTMPMGVDGQEYSLTQHLITKCEAAKLTLQ